MSLLGEMALTVRTFAAGTWSGGTFHDGTAAVWTVTVDTATDAEVYGVDLDAPVSVSVSVTAGISSTASTIGAALADAWNESAAIVHAIAEHDGSGTVTFTAATTGVDVDLVLDENAAKMTLEQTVDEVATYVDAPFVGTFRPMSAKEQQLLESGDRVRDPRVIHAETRLTLGSQFTGQRSAQVSPDSGATWYELIDEFDGYTALSTPGIRHWRYKALRLQEADG